MNEPPYEKANKVTFAHCEDLKQTLDRSKAVVLMWSLLAVWCQSFGDVSLYVCSLQF